MVQIIHKKVHQIKFTRNHEALYQYLQMIYRQGRITCTSVYIFCLRISNDESPRESKFVIKADFTWIILII
jgi:hypothetical protein